MNTIKKHFDKALLAGLLLIFCLVLVVQLFSVMASTTPIGEKEMEQLKSLRADYKGISTEPLSGNKALLGETFWTAKENVDTSIKWASDLFEVPTSSENDKAQLLRCRHCKKLVPYSDFANNECSECGKEIQVAVVVEIIDTDKDGIPDDVETSIGMDPKSNDLDSDIDEDGFSNWEEYKIAINDPINADKTIDEIDFSAIIDARKHPALNCYLAFEAEQKRVLPFYLQTITPQNKDDTTTWSILIRTGKNNLRSYRIGDTFSYRNEKWTIKDAGLREKTINFSKTDSIRLENAKKENIVIEALQKEKIYHPQRRYILKDCRPGADKPKIAIPIGDKFAIGTNVIGVENYKLISFHADKKAVTIENTLDSSKIIIEQTPKRTGIVTVSEPELDAGEIPQKTQDNTPSLDNLF